MGIVALISAGLVTACIHLCIIGFDSGVATICSVILLHQFVVTSGMLGTGFYIHVCIPEKAAKELGWPGGPCQTKYGFAQLGIGIMGILSIWFRGTFWAAVLITLYVNGISGLYTHTLEIKKKSKKSSIEMANIVLDIIYHIALTILSLYVPGVWHIG